MVKSIALSYEENGLPKGRRTIWPCVRSEGVPLVRKTPPYDGAEFTGVHRWIRRLVGLSVAPPEFLRVVWNNCLANPPWTGDNQVDANLTTFHDYYFRQWLPNRERVEQWNHYDQDGPRTTNHAEGYHRGLSTLFDTRIRRRLPLGIFMGKMQELHHEIRQRVK